ncbi:MAG: aryl-sulfate sulfotransferase [Myxococcota bacterium]
MLLPLALLGCHGDPNPAPPADTLAVTEGPTLDAPPPGPVVGGVRTLHVATDRPAALSATLTGPEGPRTLAWPAADRHDVPIVGLRPDADYELAVTLSADGDDLALTPLPLRGDPLPDGFPDVTVLEAHPDRAAPGATLLGAYSPGGPGAWVLLFDAAGVPVWWLAVDPFLSVLLPTDDGLVALGADDILALDWTGAVTRHLTPNPQDPADVPLAVPYIHHELFPLPDGGWLTLGQRAVDVDAYPVSYADPETLQPATIADNLVYELSADGAVRRELSLAEVLDTTRIGFNGLDRALFQLPGYDWAHANGVVLDPRDGDWIVSVRHQDALVKLTPAGEIRWILGDPAGWQAPWAEHLLTQAAPFRWPYHAHAPELDPDGLVLLFDNGNDGHTPYDPPPAEVPTSRLVALDVDEDAGTVSLAWSFAPERDGPLSSLALGDCDRLANGDVLGVWGLLVAEGGATNLAQGRGLYSTRVIEVDPTDDASVLDLRLSSDRAANDVGWGVYRAERILLPGAR